MSILVDIVVPDVARIHGLVEELGSWGPEALPHDPPRYRFGALSFTLVPLTESCRQALPSGLRDVMSLLTLSPPIAHALASGALREEHAAALSTLFLELGRSFEEVAVVYDTCGGPLVLRSVHTSELFDALMAVAPESDGCFVIAASRVSPYRG